MGYSSWLYFIFVLSLQLLIQAREKRQITEDKLLYESFCFHFVAPGDSSCTVPQPPSKWLDVCRGCSPPPSGNTTVCSASQGAGYLVRFVRAFNRLLSHVPLKYLRQRVPNILSASRWAQVNYLHLPAGQLARPGAVLTQAHDCLHEHICVCLSQSLGRHPPSIAPFPPLLSSLQCPSLGVEKQPLRRWAPA